MKTTALLDITGDGGRTKFIKNSTVKVLIPDGIWRHDNLVFIPDGALRFNNLALIPDGVRGQPVIEIVKGKGSRVAGTSL